MVAGADHRYGRPVPASVMSAMAPSSDAEITPAADPSSVRTVTECVCVEAGLAESTASIARADGSVGTMISDHARQRRATKVQIHLPSWSYHAAASCASGLYGRGGWGADLTVDQLGIAVRTNARSLCDGRRIRYRERCRNSGDIPLGGTMKRRSIRPLTSNERGKEGSLRAGGVRARDCGGVALRARL